MRRIMLSIALALGLALGTTACASPSEPIALDESTIIVDVRTPAEFDSGHLDGAINLDVQSAEFDTLVGQLDPEGSYVVYCRSGNRSAQAIDRMSALGFTNLTDAGSIENASSSTGLAIVTGP